MFCKPCTSNKSVTRKDTKKYKIFPGYIYFLSKSIKQILQKSTKTLVSSNAFVTGAGVWKSVRDQELDLDPVARFATAIYCAFIDLT